MTTPIDPSRLPGNSHAAKTRPKIEKAIEGEVRVKKKGLGSRVAESIKGDDSRTVGDYLLFDIIIPQGKSLVSELVAQAIDRLLFGEAGGRRRPLGSGRTSYGAISSSSGATMRTLGVPASREPLRTKEIQSADEIIFDNRGQAEVVLLQLQTRIDDYGNATVTDLKDLVGVSAEFTDQNWGWKSLNGARVVRDGSGYIIDLPRAIPL